MKLLFFLSQSGEPVTSSLSKVISGQLKKGLTLQLLDAMMRASRPNERGVRFSPPLDSTVHGDTTRETSEPTIPKLPSLPSHAGRKG
jgi:hypothetical protein